MSEGARWPIRTPEKDGRNIDPNLGTLSGEGSQQRVRNDSVPLHAMKPRVSDVEASRQPGALLTDPTYYDRPVIKKSVWSWDIPAYYYVGGATGGSMVLGAAATMLDREELSNIVLHSRIIGVIGATASSVLLIHDLGMPSRFLNMLRVFRPTSPMSVGSWILVTFSSLTGLSLITELGPPWLRRLGDFAAVTAGVFGLGLAGYTGVLVSHTTVPLWQRPHRLMPVLFLSSAVTSAASLFDIIGGNAAEARAVRLFGTAGKLAEILAAEMVERNVATVPEVARPFREGFSGALWNGAKLFTTASLVIALAPRRGRGLRRIAGVLGTLGAICTRFGVHYAGQRSAMNPRATFHQQRSGQGAFEVTGKAAITGPAGERAVKS